VLVREPVLVLLPARPVLRERRSVSGSGKQQSRRQKKKLQAAAAAAHRSSLPRCGGRADAHEASIVYLRQLKFVTTARAAVCRRPSKRCSEEASSGDFPRSAKQIQQQP